MHPHWPALPQTSPSLLASGIYYATLNFYEVMKYLSFCGFFFFLVNIMISNSICDSSNDSFMADQYSILYMYYILFMDLSVDRHSDCFHFWAVVNGAAMHMGVQMSPQHHTSFPLDIHPVMGSLDLAVVLFLILWRTSVRFSRMSVLIHSPTSSVQFPFFNLANSFSHFYISHSYWGEVISY